MKIFRNTSLRQQLLTSTMGIVIFVISVVLLVFVVYEIDFDLKHLKNNFDLNSKLIAEYSAVPMMFDDREGAGNVLKKLESIPGILSCGIYDANGELYVLYRKDTNETISLNLQDVSEAKVKRKQFLIKKDIVYGDEKFGTLVLRATTQGFIHEVRSKIFQSVILVIIALIITYFIASRIQRRFYDPVVRLKNSMQEVSEKKDFSIRIEENINNELGTLFKGFNQMISELDKREQERGKSRKELETQYNRFLTILDGFPEIMYITDTDTNEILFVNKHVKELLGTNPIGLTCHKAIQGINTMCPFCKKDKILIEDKPYVWEYYNEKFNKHYQVNDQIIKWPDGKDVHFQISTDITRRKEAEGKLQKINEELEKLVRQRTNELEHKTKNLEESQKALKLLLEDVNESREELKTANRALESANKDLESFAYSISHDLRAPLRHIEGFTNILEKNITEKNDKIVSYFEKIRNASSKMYHQIDDLLTFSRIGRTKINFMNIDLNQLIKEILIDYKSDIDDRKIEWDIAKIPSVNGDRNLLKMAFENLISNAIKFTGKTGDVKIEIGFKLHGTNIVDVYVKDNGVGFDMKYADKLFGVFQRLHSSNEYEGTGIGLANVKRIILGHNGQIWAEGKVNEGATFFVSLQKSKSVQNEQKTT